MAKKPNVPCARCGNLMWWSRGRNLPAGQATCRDCRTKAMTPRPVAARSCTVCGVAVLNPGQKCDQHKGMRRRVCRWCGDPFIGSRGGTCCSDECRQVAAAESPVLRRLSIAGRAASDLTSAAGP